MQIVQPHPGIAGLYLSAEAAPTRRGSLSATGLATCPDLARQLSAAELAERRVVSDLRADGALPRHGFYGAAAGPDRDFARAGALRELCERVAAADWWRGGAPARRAPARALRTAATLLARHPRRQPRRTGLLDIGAVPGVTVIVAWSAEADGRGLCFGLACRGTPAAAAEAAVIELFQMEFALALARARRLRGGSLPVAEAQLLDRAARLSSAWLRRRRPGPPRAAQPAAARPAVRAGRLHRAGLRIWLFETRAPEAGLRVAVARLLPAAAVPRAGRSPPWPLY